MIDVRTGSLFFMLLVSLQATLRADDDEYVWIEAGRGVDQVQNLNEWYEADEHARDAQESIEYFD